MTPIINTGFSDNKNNDLIDYTSFKIKLITSFYNTKWSLQPTIKLEKHKLL